MQSMKTENKESAVNFIGKLDKSIYRCVANGITTDEVIITDERIQHIRDHHPGHYEAVAPFLQMVIAEPDYILGDTRNTGLVLKWIEENGTRIQIVLRLHTSADTPGYKNSIISAWKISESRWNNYLRNKHILYKRK